MKTKVLAALVAAAAMGSGAASASLTEFQTFVGNVGYSSDGCGSTSDNCTIRASVPVGSTVLAAYLYTGMNRSSGVMDPTGSTLNGNAVSFGPVVLNASNTFLSMARADVTSIVKPLIDGGPGGIYSFAVHEGSGGQDGEGLIVVYSNAAIATSTFAVLDGFSDQNGDSTAVNFANPLNPAAPGFVAEMIIGDNFSCCNQTSTVTVNGTVITRNAGNNDDSQDLGVANGNLITVGGFNDPYSPMLPSYADDHERYNLIPQITAGDTSIHIDTVNPSRDDNIFMASFYVTGIAAINKPPTPSVPEPASVALVGLGLAALGARRLRR